MVQAALILVEKGIHPEIFNSSNTDKGLGENYALISKYKLLVKIL